MCNNNDDNDKCSGHIDEGSGGGHTKEGLIDNKDSKGGYIKEEAYVKEEEGEEEDIYDVSNREREAQRVPGRNQDP
jgi:hypothetical protein